METLARVLLTLTVVGYGLITVVADLNHTHATNPKWTPHARFHVVWQVLSYVGVGLVAMYLIWSEGPNPHERLYLTAALGIAIYGSFFAAVAARPIFDGALHDDNEYGLLKMRFGQGHWRWDANVSVFAFFSTIAVAGVLAAFVS
jgi:hypothetical protein